VQVSIIWHFTDTDERYRMELSNGALIHHPTDGKSNGANATIELTKRDLLELLATGPDDGLDIDGDASALQRLVELTDNPDPSFPIVTP
jgi:alkyl sulfatase BDS1-like metallo-beta-lactamase superfamily hydrolase